MSYATTAAPTKPSKIDRFLSAVRMGKSPSVTDATAVTVPVTERIAYSTDNLVTKLNASGLKRIKLTGSLVFSFEAEISGKVLKAKQSNALFEKDADKIASAWIGTAIDELVVNMGKVLRDVDENSSIPEAVVQAVFEKYCTGENARLSSKYGALLNDYVASNKAIARSYREYKIKAISSIAQHISVAIVSVVITGVTWGATGPVAVVAVVRGCAGIGVEIYKYAIDANRVIKDIENTLTILGRCMTAIADGASGKGKKIAVNTTFEAAMGAAGGILGVPLPSIKSLGDWLELLEVKLKEMHLKRQKLGVRMQELTVVENEYGAKLKEFRTTGSLPAEVIKKHEAYIDKAKSKRGEMMVVAEAAFQNMGPLLARQKDFEAQMQLYLKSVQKWSLSTRPVFGFATSVGLAVGSSDSGLEKGLSFMIETMAFVKETWMD